MLPRRLLTPVALRAALLACVLLTYGPHLRGDFVWDDREYILEEPRMRSPGGALALATQPFARGNSVYRPLSTLSFWLQVRAHGMSMPWLRAGSVAVHAAVTLALFGVLRALGAGAPAAALVAALFALHPGATEGVMFVNGRNDTLGGLFALLALGFALRPAATARARAAAAAGAAAMTLLAMSCKEVFALTPALLALAALLPGVSPGPPGARLRRAAELAGASAALIAAALAWRRHLGIVTSNALSGAPVGEVARGVAGVVSHYVTLAVTGRQGPTALSWRAPSNASVALWCAALAALSAGLAVARRRDPATADRAALGVAWMVLFAATAALAVPSTGQHANRYLYAPLLGWALALGALTPRVETSPPRVRMLAGVGGLALLAVFGATSAAQASRWQTSLALFGADVTDHPDDARALYHYGVAVARAGGCPAALPWFARSAALEPAYSRAWHNVAGCLLQMGRAAEAVGPARRAATLVPSDARNALNLGAALALSGDRAGAEPWLRRGCAALPRAAACALR